MADVNFLPLYASHLLRTCHALFLSHDIDMLNNSWHGDCLESETAGETEVEVKGSLPYASAHWRVGNNLWPKKRRD